MKRLYRPTSALLIGCMTASTMPAAAQTKTLTCSSDTGSYRYCRADTQNWVTLTRQLSGSCQQGYSWGYDYRGIWVDRGCCAEFQYGTGNSNNDSGGSNTGAAIAAGILGAVIVGSIIASQHADDNGNYNSARDYYRDGYRQGQRDWDDGLGPYYLRYRSRFPPRFENDFSAGYDAGYYNRPSQYR